MEHFYYISSIVILSILYFSKLKENDKLKEKAEYFKNKYKSCKSDLCKQ